MLVLWIVAALAAKLSLAVIGIGSLIWLIVFYLTARGLFWYWTYALNFNPFKTDAALRKAVACRPLLPQPYLTAAVFSAKKKQWSETIPLLERAAELSGKGTLSQIQSILAVAYRETGDLDKATAMLAALETAGVKSAHLYTNYAAVYLQRADYPAVFTAAAKARSFNVNATEPVLITAKAHFLQGDYQAAKDDYEWVLPRLSWPVETFYWLGRAELELRLPVAAREHLQKAVARIGEDPDLSDVPLTEAQFWLDKANSAISEQ